MRPGVRQALLRPAFAHLYPGIPTGEWAPAAVMRDRVLALRLRAGTPATALQIRMLDEDHFEYRGVVSAGSRDQEVRSRREDREEEK